MMQVLNGIPDQQSALTMQSMAFRTRRGQAPFEMRKWARRKTFLFIAASSTFLWTAIVTTAWLTI